MKELKEQAYIAGREAFGVFGCSPSLNASFMKTVPNCDFGDTKGCRLRAAMYKQYINGWTTANLSQGGV